MGKKEIIKTYTPSKILSRNGNAIVWEKNPGLKFQIKIEAQKA